MGVIEKYCEAVSLELIGLLKMYNVVISKQ
jgi:hypothetical protein